MRLFSTRGRTGGGIVESEHAEIFVADEPFPIVMLHPVVLSMSSLSRMPTTG